MRPVLITTTIESLQEAKAISHALIKEKLAGCVNIIGPIISMYEWENKIEEENEYKLFIKSKEKNWKKIEKIVKKMHSYSTPELSMIKIDNIHAAYDKWLASVVNS